MTMTDKSCMDVENLIFKVEIQFMYSIFLAKKKKKKLNMYMQNLYVINHFSIFL